MTCSNPHYIYTDAVLKLEKRNKGVSLLLRKFRLKERDTYRMQYCTNVHKWHIIRKDS